MGALFCCWFFEFSFVFVFLILCSVFFIRPTFIDVCTFLGAYINDFCPNGVRLNVMFYVVEVLTSAVFGSRLLTFVCILRKSCTVNCLISGLSVYARSL